MLIFWREMVIGTLLVALTAMGNMYLGKRDEVIEMKAHQGIIEGLNHKAIAEVEERSRLALETLKAEHVKKQKEIENNAWANFRRRYPSWSGCLPAQPPVPPSGKTAAAPSSPEPSHDPSKEFVAACAADANTVSEFQRWVRINRLPVDGE